MLINKCLKLHPRAVAIEDIGGAEAAEDTGEVVDIRARTKVMGHQVVPQVRHNQSQETYLYKQRR